MNKVILIGLFVLLLSIGALAEEKKVRGGDPGTAAFSPCHTSLLESYLYPYHAVFSPGYQGSRPVMDVTTAKPTNTVVIPDESNNGYYIYSNDGNITHLPKPARKLDELTRPDKYYQYTFDKQKIFIAEDGKEKFDGAINEPNRGLGSKSYKPLYLPKKEKSAAKEEAAEAARAEAGLKAVKREILNLVKGACEHYTDELKETIQQGDPKDSANYKAHKARAKDQLSKTLYTCARVMDEEIAVAAGGQATSCHLKNIIPGRDEEQNAKVIDDHGAGPKEDGNRPDNKPAQQKIQDTKAPAR